MSSINLTSGISESLTFRESESSSIAALQQQQQQQQEFQEAVILDEHGHPTQEIVYLTSNESGEMQVIERSQLTLTTQEEYHSSSQLSSIDKASDLNAYQQSSQTIIICQDPETNQVSVTDSKFWKIKNLNYNS